MVADFPQLHQHVHNAEEVGICKSCLGFVHVDVLVVKQALSATQVALNDVLYLLWQLLFDVFLHSSEQEWPENRLEFLNDSDVERLVLIYTLTKWIRKPLLEVLLVAEDLRHQEMHQ